MLFVLLLRVLYPKTRNWKASPYMGGTLLWLVEWVVFCPSYFLPLGVWGESLQLTEQLWNVDPCKFSVCSLNAETQRGPPLYSNLTLIMHETTNNMLHGSYKKKKYARSALRQHRHHHHCCDYSSLGWWRHAPVRRRWIACAAIVQSTRTFSANCSKGELSSSLTWSNIILQSSELTSYPSAVL